MNVIRKSLLSVLLGTALSTSFSMAWASPEAPVVQRFIQDNNYLRMGQLVVETASLQKLYSLRGFEPIWSTQGRANAHMTALRELFINQAPKHGLRTEDYLTSDLEYLISSPNTQNWPSLEFSATEALLRYAQHLSGGRIDPESVDTDIKFKQKVFADYAVVNTAASGAPQDLAAAIENLAPQHEYYKELLQILTDLRGMKGNQVAWANINSPGIELKTGVTNPAVGRLRTRLNQMGYVVPEGSNLYDQELSEVVHRFQANHGLQADGTIGSRSPVWRVVNFTLNQRIAQVEANLEKLRWMPRELESRYLFVNLAASEMRVVDQGSVVMEMKTINGQALRRTPSMRDKIAYIVLNPTWTVPFSIAINDKLPMIKKDIGYLEKMHLRVFDNATEQEVDPSTIDWQAMNRRTFTYYLRQDPSYENALGVMKFMMTNPWAIYLHDTNERNLFEQSMRLRSSGCIRLERPAELAQYLLQGTDWTAEAIDAFVFKPGREGEIELEKNLYLKNPLTVYTMYLTVQKAKDGGLRFLDDYYGQDERLARALDNKRIKNEAF